MLQRIQTGLIVVLLGAVGFLGVGFYRSQRANEAAIAKMTEMLDNLTGPSVAQTVPQNGDNNVAPSLKEIRVTYDREMSEHSWSWCQAGEQGSIYPQTTGTPHYDADKRTCVLPVKLEPGTSYAIRLNSGDFRAFRDAAGRPATPYLLRFATRGAAAKAASAPAVNRPQPALEFPAENVKYSPAGSDDDAKTLIARVLKVNRPWIEPKPVKASYRLLRADENEKETKGPFSVHEGCKSAVRVGSIVWTPLHDLARKDTHYSVHMLGKADWKGKSLIAVELVFDPPVRTGVGMGGQAETSYSASNSSTAKARIVIEPARAIPLFIDCWSATVPSMGRPFHSVWAFDPDFFELDGGLAPKAFVWEEVSAFRERQEFQVVDGIWIFKQGDAWYGAESPFHKSGHIQRLELADLKVGKTRR